MSALLRRVHLVTTLALLTSCLALLPPRADAGSTPAPGFSIPAADGSPGSWIGSYSIRGAQTYCIDPRRRGSSTAAVGAPRQVLRSMRDVTGRPVSTKDLQRVAWIASTAGVTTNPVRAAAVDTAIYALVGRGRYAWGAARSEARMRATGHYDQVRAKARQLLLRSAHFAGASHVRLSAPSRVYGTGPVSVTATVTTEYGVPVPGVRVTTDHPLDDRGAVTGVTGADGRVRWTFSPTRVGSASMTAVVAAVASRFPTVLVPQDRRFQRLVIAGLHHDVRATVTTSVTPAPISITTVTSATVVDPGDSLTDTVTVTAPADYHATITARLYGPFAERPTASSCAPETVAWTVTQEWTGSGTFSTPPVGPLTEPGYYTWVEESPATATTQPARTTCGEVSETTLVRRYRPRVVTQASTGRAVVGASLTDAITVSDFPEATSGTINAYLAGPFASFDQIRCRIAASQRVAVAITGPGRYVTSAIRVTRPGWYSWFEVLPATPASEPVRTPCRLAVESTLVTRPTPATVRIDSGPDRVARTARQATPYAALSVPAVGLRVQAFPAGATQGVLPLPDGSNQAAWYAATARFPDRIGNMLVAGHVSTSSGGVGPFGRLARVRPGMRVVVTRDGVERILEVVSTRTYSRSNPLPASAFDQTGRFRVVLVTCTHRVTRPDGSWHYTDNLVVTAR